MMVQRILVLLYILVPSCAWTTAIIQQHSQRHGQRLDLLSLSAKGQQQDGASKRKFAQPTPRRAVSDGRLMDINAERIRNAGRVGTKRFVDPCKVFVGNLPFDVNEKDLFKFILDTMGQTRLVLMSAKVIKDWKTGKSKGYGFCVFSDPIYATVCMEVVNGKPLNGRAVTVSQGKKKAQDNQLYIKKSRQVEELSEEDAAIVSALEEAESEEEDDVRVFGGGSEEDIELDARLFGIAATDDDDDGIDGIFLEKDFKFEDVDPSLNREQRREAQRKMKRNKKQAKGFGNV